jgi:hypothetical protein
MYADQEYTREHCFNSQLCKRAGKFLHERFKHYSPSSFFEPGNLFFNQVI